MVQAGHEKKNPGSSIIVLFLSCCFLKIVLAELWKSREINPSGIRSIEAMNIFVRFFDVTPGRPIWQLSVGTELFLDSNLIYPS